MNESDLRQQYEAAVAALARDAARQLAAGVPKEDVARWAVAARDTLKLRYREATPPHVLVRIVANTRARYGNDVGPSADDLRSEGKTWRQIIESATRAGVHGAEFFFGASPDERLPER
ncbi:hemagglutinin [Ottowia sp. GY511]|uniref:Hemagglutinin n=1 Tax=Ottowia flava TaxID=2675430 RepID=A0ABW4KWX0_9BURK|nr:hemagglutinin [Ottowia sp. GY511]TXK31483.1 hemagglutinin [Ottowia sp. GY511]